MATASNAAELTIDRLFDAPALAGPTIVGLKISPDGSRVTYLQGKPENKDRLDLWEYGIQDGRARLLVDSKALAPAEEKLSVEELNRRERQRTAALSGILEYSFAPSGRALLFPLGGNLYYYDLAKPAPEGGGGDQSLRQRLHRTPPSLRQAATSSFIRDQNLHVYDIAAATRWRSPATAAASSRTAWPNSWRRKKWTAAPATGGRPTTGTSHSRASMKLPINVTERFEIAADNVATFAQRYPAAGGANVLVRLGVADVRSGAVTWIDLGDDTDIYLARVNWLPDGKTLAIQRQSRDQRRLDLLVCRHRHRKEPRRADRNQHQLDRTA